MNPSEVVVLEVLHAAETKRAIGLPGRSADPERDVPVVCHDGSSLEHVHTCDSKMTHLVEVDHERLTGRQFGDVPLQQVGQVRGRLDVDLPADGDVTATGTTGRRDDERTLATV